MIGMKFLEANQDQDSVDLALREATAHSYRQDETDFIQQLLIEAKTPVDMVVAAQAKATELVNQIRKNRLDQGGLDAFLVQYDLSSEEGIALMCLAEALLRIPDKETVNRLIRDKLTQGKWETYLGKSHSVFVNTATWALTLTGKLMGSHQGGYAPISVEKQDNILKESLRGLANRGGKPFIRQAISQAMQLLGRQFVMGRNITEALQRAQKYEKIGYRYSYDMLGEAAYTAADAEAYLESYKQAIMAIQKLAQPLDPITSPGISVKLSALHPRFEMAQRQRILKECWPKVKDLALMAKTANISFTIDAEEADQLLLLLEILQMAINDPDLKGWNGLGVAVQAYQKRALDIIDWLIHLARSTQRILMVRLVKGAYWDSEIKHSQVNGFSQYPVFTRKAATDINFIACAKKLLAAPECIFPQFATHNAYTVGIVQELIAASNCQAYEFQCLHGMGNALFDELVKNEQLPCRIYAPVGGHDELLAYLVRRLLENGANSSFVNRIADERLPIAEIVEDPLALLARDPKPHPKIPLPKGIYGPKRTNSQGLDINDPNDFLPFLKNLAKHLPKEFHAAPTAFNKPSNLEIKEVFAPFNHQLKLGTVTLASHNVVLETINNAEQAFKQWRFTLVSKRVDILNKMALLLEEQREMLLGLIVLEGGRTFPDAIAELREAVDFCRYYALEASTKLAEPQVLCNPTGEYNQLTLHGRGIIACISPWNFPLAIFIGQVAAAFAAGNCVIAKPASQTPLLGAQAVALFHQAGVPKAVIQLLPGSGRVVGDALVQDQRIKGILFTGSTDTAWHINEKLAGRRGPIVPLVAETGGQNTMLVDSSALPEQVVVDVINSSFRSAGQRCSSLRVLYLQEDIADKILTMLIGAMAELTIGNPMSLATDVGPVIDENALSSLHEHQAWLNCNATKIYELPLSEECALGTFMAPCIYEINRIGQLKEEQFGPILHVIRYAAKDLDQVLEDINQTQYGLTLGIHSRIAETVAYIYQRAQVGNIYVNRNMIGAVVGAQPFGGEGLSGTGPKAGGPHYLTRLMLERTLSVDTTAAGGNASLMSI